MKGNTILSIVIIVLLTCTLCISYTNFKQIKFLGQENGYLQFKIDSVQKVMRQENDYLILMIDSVQQICNNLAQKKNTKKNYTEQSLGNGFLDFFIKLDETIGNVAANKNDKPKIVVSSKYTLEDRYVSYKVCEPEFLGDQVGELVLNILVNYSGDVKSAKLLSAKGITNEDVIEACKKAALRTSFNYDSDCDHEIKQSGTITYIFSKE